MGIEQSEMLIATPDGQMPAVLVAPTQSDRRPAILLLMEALGLTSHLRDVAAQMAFWGLQSGNTRWVNTSPRPISVIKR